MSTAPRCRTRRRAASVLSSSRRASEAHLPSLQEKSSPRISPAHMQDRSCDSDADDRFSQLLKKGVYESRVFLLSLTFDSSFNLLMPKASKEFFSALLSYNFTLIITVKREAAKNKTLAKGHKVKCVAVSFVPFGLSHRFCSVAVRTVCCSHDIRFMVGRLSIPAADAINPSLFPTGAPSPPANAALVVVIVQLQKMLDVGLKLLIVFSVNPAV